MLLIVQQIDNHLISPNVMSRTVGSTPVVVMLALLVEASFAGLFGMLIIVPLVAVAKIVFLFMYGPSTSTTATSSPRAAPLAHPLQQGRDRLGPALAGGGRGDDHRGGGSPSVAAQAPLATRNMAPTTPASWRSAGLSPMAAARPAPGRGRPGRRRPCRPC